MSELVVEKKKMTVREKTEYNLVLNGMSAEDAKRVTDSVITKMSIVTNYFIAWDDPSGYWSNADQLVIGLYVNVVSRKLFPLFVPTTD